MAKKAVGKGFGKGIRKPKAGSKTPPKGSKGSGGNE
jgi:hypothetical protein